VQQVSSFTGYIEAISFSYNALPSGTEFLIHGMFDQLCSTLYMQKEEEQGTSGH